MTKHQLESLTLHPAPIVTEDHRKIIYGHSNRHHFNRCEAPTSMTVKKRSRLCKLRAGEGIVFNDVEVSTGARHHLLNNVEVPWYLIPGFTQSGAVQVMRPGNLRKPQIVALFLAA